MDECIRRYSLKPTGDHLGFFGYHEGYDAYLEIFTYDRTIRSASERNRAFFDKLGLPNNL